LSVRMRAATLYHIEIAGQLTVLRATISSTMELVLGRSHNETTRVEVTNELFVKFWRHEELCSRLMGPGVRIYDLLLGPPPSQARWVDYLTEATRRLEVELTATWLVEAELGAQRTLATCIRALVLGNGDEPSSLAAYLSMVVELLEGRIDTMVANGVCWGV
jgi:hypothetical protein